MSIIGGGDDNDTLITEFDKDVDPQTPKRRGRQPYPRDENGNIIRPDGTTSKPVGRPKTKASLEMQISGFVTLINMFVQSFKPSMALDQTESTALIKAIDAECQVNARFRKYVESVVKGAGSVNLLSVVLIIVGRRVVRAGVLPIPEDSPIQAPAIDNLLGTILSATTMQKPIATMNVEA
jgi:hypothetical protein